MSLKYKAKLWLHVKALTHAKQIDFNRHLDRVSAQEEEDRVLAEAPVSQLSTSG